MIGPEGHQKSAGGANHRASQSARYAPSGRLARLPSSFWPLRLLGGNHRPLQGGNLVGLVPVVCTTGCGLPVPSGRNPRDPDYFRHPLCLRILWRPPAPVPLREARLPSSTVRVTLQKN